MIIKNVNIERLQALVSPFHIQSLYPITKDIKDTVYYAREEIKNILYHKNDKLLCIVGPCSIHNPLEAIEYAKLLVKIADKFKDKLLIVMRVYFEKPRTTIGWKGLINDPNLDNSYDINLGLRTCRKLLVDINKLGLPCGCEMLDPFIPQYIDDLVSWGAIGARTSESQTHRQMVSGLSMPVGFKNNTSGNVKVALDGIKCAKNKHVFLGIDETGNNCLVHTGGNSDCHLILRGDNDGPNYGVNFLDKINNDYNYNKIMIDCSHGNSRKDYKNQSKVCLDVIKQIKEDTDRRIIGIMLESNLKEGKQDLTDNLKKGVSITDSCISIEETEALLEQVYNTL